MDVTGYWNPDRDICYLRLDPAHPGLMSEFPTDAMDDALAKFYNATDVSGAEAPMFPYFYNVWDGPRLAGWVVTENMTVTDGEVFSMAESIYQSNARVPQPGDFAPRTWRF